MVQCSKPAVPQPEHPQCSIEISIWSVQLSEIGYTTPYDIHEFLGLSLPLFRRRLKTFYPSLPSLGQECPDESVLKRCYINLITVTISDLRTVQRNKNYVGGSGNLNIR